MIEAARTIEAWSGRPCDFERLAEIAEGTLPSVFRQAVAELVSRDRAKVRAPLGLLPTLIADQEASRDSF